MQEVLRFIVQKGFGLEAASLEELRLAAQVDIPHSKAVFDSPAKRKIEIDICASEFKGMILNVNCIEELELIPDNPDLQVGLRINPLIKTGAPSEFNVSTYRSKFGIPINIPQIIIEACLKYPYIKGLHMHSGSEIANIQNNVYAIKQLKNLADEINEIRREKDIKTRIEFIDIGGGIPADYSDQPQAGLDIYVNDIKNACPNIFDEYRLITEFGHFIHAHTSWVMSDVEYVLKYSENIPETAIIHVGADMFLRQAYSQNQKKYRISVLNSEGNIKTAAESHYDIAGPLCFAGDYLFRDRRLPKLEKNDKMIIHDIGANTYALWSKHCSRDMPKVIGYSIDSDRMEVIQQRQSWSK